MVKKEKTGIPASKRNEFLRSKALVSENCAFRNLPAWQYVEQSGMFPGFKIRIENNRIVAENHPYDQNGPLSLAKMVELAETGKVYVSPPRPPRRKDPIDWRTRRDLRRRRGDSFVSITPTSTMGGWAIPG